MVSSRVAEVSREVEWKGVVEASIIMLSRLRRAIMNARDFIVEVPAGTSLTLSNDFEMRFVKEILANGCRC